MQQAVQVLHLVALALLLEGLHGRTRCRRFRGGQVGGSATLTVILPPGLSAEQRGEVQGIAVRVTSEGISAFDRQTLPGSVQRINGDKRRRG